MNDNANNAKRAAMEFVPSPFPVQPTMRGKGAADVIIRSPNFPLDGRIPPVGHVIDETASANRAAHAGLGATNHNGPPETTNPLAGRPQFVVLAEGAEQFELDALLLLGTRETWPVDELPRGYDADLMRCMDERGWVEARATVMVNGAQHRGDTATPPTPCPAAWGSPNRTPGLVGRWESLLALTVSDYWNRPSEIRLSDTGRAALHRLRKAAGAGKGKARAEAGLSRNMRAVVLLCEQKEKGKWRLTVQQVADELEVHKGTLYRWAVKYAPLNTALSLRKGKGSRPRGYTDGRGNIEAVDE